MPFISLTQVIHGLENQDRWEKRRQFRQLVSSWAEVVGGVVAAQTRPLYVQRQVLHVATSSSVWAQNLAFERQRILEKLNAKLTYSLTDIRFSTAQWQLPQKRGAISSESDILWQEHPSQLNRQFTARTSRSPSHASVSPTLSSPPDPQAAFQSWANTIRDRTRSLPACPICQCPTPPGELQRWSVCALCAAKQMK
jgi:predicted nucleic acid-binding Zn ribbon protein